MKAVIISSLAVITLGLFSCGNSSVPKEEAKNEPIQESKACYRYKNGNDTISLSIDILDSKVTGTMVYDFYEKDGSSGTITGYISGDTLIADYDFMSEDVKSLSELVFLNKDGDYWMGVGDGEMVNDKWVFNNRSQLDFQDIQLKKVACN